MRSVKFFLLLLLCLTIGQEKLYSQKKKLRFEHIGPTEGLSQSYVTCFLQDSKGFMWIGTSEGLNKYDGYKFTVYKKEQHRNSLSHNQVNDIIEDKQGNIWIATWQGVDMFDPRKEIFTNYSRDENDPFSISSNSPASLSVDEDGNLWIGVNKGELHDKGGLNFFDIKTRRFTNYTFPDSVPEMDVTRVYEDSDHNLWVGTSDAGIYLFNRTTKEFSWHPELEKVKHNLFKSDIERVFEDSKHRIWIGTRHAGLFMLDQKSGTLKNYRKDANGTNALSSDAVSAITEDGNGLIWIGTEHGGLCILDPKNENFYNYTLDANDLTGLNSISVNDILKDEKGNMWLGTFSGGINFFNIDGNKFNHYRQNTSENSLNTNVVFCIREDSKGNILLGTDGGGLNVFDPVSGTFTYFKHEKGNKKSICGDHVLSVLEDSYHNIWVGTWGDGVTMFNPEKNIYKHFKHDPSDPTSLCANNAWVIYEDRNKNIWIGTYWSGISLYNRENDTFTNFSSDPTNPNTLGSNVINNIYEDRQGNLWIGSVNGGLDMLDRKTNTFAHYRHDKNDSTTISSDIVLGILEDSRGYLWIGTGNGLNYLDRTTGKFAHYTKEDGLIHNYIRSIIEDAKGYLWISTNGGVSRFDVQTKSFLNFTVADGLQEMEFKTHAGCKSRTGKIYFGGINGFNEFNPNEAVAHLSYEPQIMFTDFQIFNQRVPTSATLQDSPLKQHITYTSEVVLSHDQSVISFEFASLHFTAKTKKKYSYILEGFDKTWNNIDTKHAVTYTNLDPGSYTLIVRGLNNTGEWSSNTAKLNIVITPPYWMTWWFRLLVVLSCAGAVYAFYMYRFKLIQKQKQELERMVKERTRELNTANVELNSQKERLQKANKEIKDSILAAQVIHNAILPPVGLIKEHFPESFVLNLPKDVVSGDFYWFAEIGTRKVFAAADCTGHGVSGAFMSINGYHLLNKIIYDNKELTAAEMLNNLNQYVVSEFREAEHRSGMDIALCVIEPERQTIQFAGAVSPLYILRKGELIQIKADPFPIGLNPNNKMSTYTNHEIKIENGDMVYMFSDGYADQIGGPEDEKFTYKRFREFLKHIGRENCGKQLQLLNNQIMQWKGNREQLDDILIIGFKICNSTVSAPAIKKAI